MENKQDIGKAISDRLDLLDKTPKEQVWVGINEELQKKKKRRFTFFFFWMTGIGLLAIGLMTALYFFSPNEGFRVGTPKNSNKPIIVTTDHSSKNNTNGTSPGDSLDNSKITKNSTSLSGEKKPAYKHSKSGIESDPAVANENSFENKKSSTKRSGRKNNNENEILGSRKNKKGIYTRSKESKVAFLKSKSAKAKSHLISKITNKTIGKDTPKPNQTKQDLGSVTNGVDKKDATSTDLTSLQDKKTEEPVFKLIPKKIDSVVPKKEEEKDLTKNILMYKKDSLPNSSYKKFDVDVFVSPTYYGYSSKGSAIDSRLDSLSRKSIMKISYGVGLSYGLSERLTFRVGYSKINLSYLTKNAPIFVSDYSGIAYNSGISNETIYFAATEPQSGINSMDITQKISYTEIPFEFKYKFLDRKFGIKSSLGFSYLLLSENTVSIKTPNGYSLDIGKTRDLATSIFSFNIGLEFDYPIFKSLKVFAEPMFNYQVKSYSASDLKAYYYGVHCGLRYSFNN